MRCWLQRNDGDRGKLLVKLMVLQAERNGDVRVRYQKMLLAMWMGEKERAIAKMIKMMITTILTRVNKACEENRRPLVKGMSCKLMRTMRYWLVGTSINDECGQKADRRLLCP